LEFCAQRLNKDVQRSQIYNWTSNGAKLLIDETLTKFYYGGQDFCSGDSGGPM